MRSHFVTALDFSSIAIKGLIKHAKERSLLNSIYAFIFDPRNKPIPFSKDEFDLVYSHMFFNMHFTWEELKFMFQDIRRVLKHDGFNFFSVRNHNDKSYGQGKQIDNDIYDINGFQIRFFTKQHVKALVKGEGFKIFDIKEIYKESVTLNGSIFYSETQKMRILEGTKLQPRKLCFILKLTRVWLLPGNYFRFDHFLIHSNRLITDSTSS